MQFLCNDLFQIQIDFVIYGKCIYCLYCRFLIIKARLFKLDARPIISKTINCLVYIDDVMALIITVCVCKYSIVYSACLKVALWSRWCWRQETNPSLTSIWIAGLTTPYLDEMEKSLLKAKQEAATLWDKWWWNHFMLYMWICKTKKIISLRNCQLGIQSGCYLRRGKAPPA